MNILMVMVGIIHNFEVCYRGQLPIGNLNINYPGRWMIVTLIDPVSNQVTEVFTFVPDCLQLLWELSMETDTAVKLQVTAIPRPDSDSMAVAFFNGHTN